MSVRQDLITQSQQPNYSRMSTIGEKDLVGYLKHILSRYSGYPFVSISRLKQMDKLTKSNKIMGAIQVHKRLPTMTDEGAYISTADQPVTLVELNDPEFPGMVMDRTGKATFGNPFKVELDNPELESLLNEAFKPKQVVLDLSKK